jgi:hypothetical protein
MQRLLAGLILALLCVGLHAQAINLRASIPFAFHASDQLMPAGEYIISYSDNALRLHEVAGKHNVLVITH